MSKASEDFKVEQAHRTRLRTSKLLGEIAKMLWNGGEGQPSKKDVVAMLRRIDRELDPLKRDMDPGQRRWVEMQTRRELSIEREAVAGMADAIRKRAEP